MSKILYDRTMTSLMSIFSLAEDTSLIKTSPHILPSIRSAVQCRFVTWLSFSENIPLFKKRSAV